MARLVVVSSGAIVVESIMLSQTVDLTEIVEAHTAYLLRAAYAFGLYGTDAEDLVQEAFTTFLEIRERFEGRSSVRTFLYGILYRKNLERSRKAARETPVDPVEGKFASRFDSLGMWQTPPRGPAEQALTAETEELIADCLKQLPASQRGAFFLKEVEHLSSEEICNAIAVKPTNLRVLLFRARNGLRECLEGKWEGKR